MCFTSLQQPEAGRLAGLAGVQRLLPSSVKSALTVHSDRGAVAHRGCEFAGDIATYQTPTFALSLSQTTSIRSFEQYRTSFGRSAGTSSIKT